MSCRDRLNDLEELIYSMGPERVNVPSKMEQFEFPHQQNMSQNNSWITSKTLEIKI